jgi:hypothetical protein
MEEVGKMEENERNYE